MSRSSLCMLRRPIPKSLRSFITPLHITSRPRSIISFAVGVRGFITQNSATSRQTNRPLTGNFTKMALRTLGPKQAAALDEELMSTGGFSIDQLMELAGLSVSQAVYKMVHPSQGTQILVACGPGNNGGDGLVAARHLHHYGYHPTVYYPKQSSSDLYARLVTQLKSLSIPIITSFPADLIPFSLLVDAIFGFSFSGEVREPFPAAIAALASSKVPVLAVDAPSSWNIETGPPSEGAGSGYQPAGLISLTAPKPLVQWFTGRHFVGGRFLSKAVADKYDLDVPDYKGIDQIVEVPVGDHKL